ncbi:hypothetical protein PG985_000357 [Apiospora marii]|uniref:uncharacterized protein n=1 Tax=Apiospora marii TaxID=335849 RepID=UPI003130F8C7
MSSTSPVALILGSGARVGKSVAQAFANKGYRIALVARSIDEGNSTANELHIKGDFADPSSIPAIFSQVEAKFGPPAVVIYNAGATTFNDKADPLSVPLENFSRHFAINATSAFMAAKHAALAFAALPASASRTFIYTGNCTNVAPITSLFDLGVGKSGAASMIQVAAEAYRDKGFKFYYADERMPDGSPMYNDLNGDAHADMYTELAEGESQGPWSQTFVKGVGYKEF